MRLSAASALGLLLCSSLLLCGTLAGPVAEVGSTDSGGASRGLLQSHGRQAYITLLYGDDFVLGVRVLGQSLRETGTTRELVVLSVGSALSPTATHVLESDGWRVVPVEVVQNPAMAPRENFDGGFPKKFWAVYTKLLIFNMSDYERVVYLDADTIVMSNIDELFSCHGFCANLKHSERFNTGAMVVEPSAQVFNDIMARIHHMHSYTGGDQGFLNSYFAGFPNAPMFVPGEEKDPATTKMERLPTAYNADVGLYMINSAKWMIPAKDVRVMHFTLGPFKPWNWWTVWLIDVTSNWQGFRSRLPIKSQAPGLLPGETKSVMRQRYAVMLAPLLVGAVVARQWLATPLRQALMARRAAGRAAGGAGGMSRASSLSALLGAGRQPTIKMPPRVALQAIAVGVMSIALGGYIAVSVVPTEVFPMTGWFLTYEVMFSTFLLCYGKYLHIAYQWGHASPVDRGAGDTQQKGHVSERPWGMTFIWAAVVLFGLVATPWLGNWMGLRAITAKIGAIVGTLFLTTMVMTYGWMETAAAWYMAGAREAESTTRV